MFFGEQLDMKQTINSSPPSLEYYVILPNLAGDVKRIAALILLQRVTLLSILSIITVILVVMKCGPSRKVMYEDYCYLR